MLWIVTLFDRCSLRRLWQTLRWPHRRMDPWTHHLVTSFTVGRETNSAPCLLCLVPSQGSCLDWEPQGTWSASQINIMELIDQLKFSWGTDLECAHSISVCYPLRSRITSLHSLLHTWIWALRSQCNDAALAAPFVSFCCLVLVEFSYFCLTLSGHREQISQVLAMNEAFTKILKKQLHNMTNRLIWFFADS